MDYCSLNSAWQHDRSLHNLVRYTVQSLTEEWDDTKTEENEDNFTSPNPNHVEFRQDCEERDKFELCVACKLHYAVSVIAFEIVSEARTIEYYGGRDGYLGTIRGTPIDSQSESETGPAPLYRCQIKLQDPLLELSLKFLGLGDRKTCTVCKLRLVLAPSGQSGQSIMAGSPGKVDLSKVKGYLHSMGDSIPENAMELLQSVEQFQNTHMSGLQQLQSMFSQFSTSPLNSRLVAKATEVDNHQTSELPSKQDTNPPSTQAGSFPTGLGPLQSLLQSFTQTGQSVHEGQGDSEGQGQSPDAMYKMLQGICGRVSEMRLDPSTTEQPEPGEPDTADRSTTATSGTSRTEESPRSVPQVVASEDVQDMLHNTVAALMKQTEQRLMEYIEKSMSELEGRLMTKLETLSHQSLVSCPTGQQPDLQDES